MKAPKGMKWISITYEADRIDESRADGVFRGEAGMQLLVEASVADCLVYGGSIAEIYIPYVTAILRAREQLCRGRYVEDTAIVEIEEEA